MFNLEVASGVSFLSTENSFVSNRIDPIGNIITHKLIAAINVNTSCQI